MSATEYKRLCQIDVKNVNLVMPSKYKKRFVVVHVRSTATLVFGASCFNCIGASCYNCNNDWAARTDGSSGDWCADKDCNNNMKRVNALLKPSVHVNASSVKQN